jgi:hypothetical protein
VVSLAAFGVPYPLQFLFATHWEALLVAPGSMEGTGKNLALASHCRVVELDAGNIHCPYENLLREQRSYTNANEVCECVSMRSERRSH